MRACQALDSRSAADISSDVHFWKEGRIGNNVLCQECGAGHESAGEVIEVGTEVTQWKVGDRVAMEAGIPCGRADCPACLSGSYKSCKRGLYAASRVLTPGPKMVFFSSPPYHGTMTRFHAHPAAWLHRLPDNVSYGEGALVEPLAVGLEAVDIANVRLGDPVLIWYVKGPPHAVGSPTAEPDPLAWSRCYAQTQLAAARSSSPISCSPAWTWPRSSSLR